MNKAKKIFSHIQQKDIKHRRRMYNAYKSTRLDKTAPEMFWRMTQNTCFDCEYFHLSRHFKRQCELKGHSGCFACNEYKNKYEDY